MADYTEHLKHTLSYFKPWSEGTSGASQPLPVASAHQIDEQTWHTLRGNAPPDADLQHGQPVKLTSGEVVAADEGDSPILGIFDCYIAPDKCRVFYAEGQRLVAPMDATSTLGTGDETDFVLGADGKSFYLDADGSSGAFELIHEADVNEPNAKGKRWVCQVAHRQLGESID